MNTLTEPTSKENNGIIYFDIPYETSISEWLSKHEESDFIADELSNGNLKIYCYAKNVLYNAELEKIRTLQYPDKGIFNGTNTSFGGLWI